MYFWWIKLANRNNLIPRLKVSKETISDTIIYNSFQNFVKWKKSIVLKRIFIICSIVIFFIKDGYSQKIEKSLWHGFEKESFSVGSRNAYIVKPVHALPGNPWVWRASFPDWHTDMDSILLSKGFYIAYLSVDDQYGSPQSLQV